MLNWQWELLPWTSCHLHSYSCVLLLMVPWPKMYLRRLGGVSMDGQNSPPFTHFWQRVRGKRETIIFYLSNGRLYTFHRVQSWCPRIAHFLKRVGRETCWDSYGSGSIFFPEYALVFRRNMLGRWAMLPERSLITYYWNCMHKAYWVVTFLVWESGFNSRTDMSRIYIWDKIKPHTLI